MEFDEFKIIVKGLKAVYTSDNFLPTNEAVKIWYSMLKDIQYNVMTLAVKKYMMTAVYPPTIADLRRLSAEVTTEGVPDWSEAWQEARQSVSNFGMYRQEEALNSLSPLTKKVIEHLGFQELCTCEEIDVYRGQFRMAYENLANQEKQNAQMPSALKDLIEVTRQKMIGVNR